MSLVHLHLMLNHFPVIGVIFVAIILIAAMRLRSSDVSKLALWLLAGVGVVTAFVYFTGEPAEDSVENLAGVSKAAIHAHEFAAETAFVATAIIAGFALLALWWHRNRQLPRSITGLMLALTIVVSGFMAWTANLGGQIRHTEIAAGSVQSAGEVERGEH
jgi:uncharacterized membrane protein